VRRADAGELGLERHRPSLDHFLASLAQQRVPARACTMAPTDAAALTAQLRAHLQSYLAHSAAISQTLRDANTLQQELEADQGKDVRDRLESVYDRIDEQTEAEFL